MAGRQAGAVAIQHATHVTHTGPTCGVESVTRAGPACMPRASVHRAGLRVSRTLVQSCHAACRSGVQLDTQTRSFITPDTVVWKVVHAEHSTLSSYVVTLDPCCQIVDMLLMDAVVVSTTRLLGVFL